MNNIRDEVIRSMQENISRGSRVMELIAKDAANKSIKNKASRKLTVIDYIFLTVISLSIFKIGILIGMAINAL